MSWSTTQLTDHPKFGKLIGINETDKSSDMRGMSTAEIHERFKTGGKLKTIHIRGQIMGGKNNIGITRTGKRYPKAKWAAWRDDAVGQVRRQLPAGFATITTPTTVSLEYVAGDRRRRDMPAIVDSIWHVLEKAGVVADDTLLWIGWSSRGFDEENPRAVIEIL